MHTPLTICSNCDKKLNEIGTSQPCSVCYMKNHDLSELYKYDKRCDSENCYNDKEEHSSHCSKCLIKIKEIEDLIESTKIQIKAVIEHLKDKYGIEKICIFETN